MRNRFSYHSFNFASTIVVTRSLCICLIFFCSLIFCSSFLRCSLSFVIFVPTIAITIRKGTHIKSDKYRLNNLERKQWSKKLSKEIMSDKFIENNRENIYITIVKMDNFLALNIIAEFESTIFFEPMWIKLVLKLIS